LRLARSLAIIRVLPAASLPEEDAVSFNLPAFTALLLALAAAEPVHAADPAAVEQGVRLYEQGRDSEARATLLPAATAMLPIATAAFTLGRIAMREDDV